MLVEFDIAVIPAIVLLTLLCLVYAETPDIELERLRRTHRVRQVHVKQASSPLQTGFVTATPTDNDVEYWCPVTIGDQTFKMDFDTGSTDLWVFSKEVPQEDWRKHTIYDPQQNPEPGRTWSISYGTGSASGNVYKDTVSLGDADSSKLIVYGQEVEAAAVVDKFFIDNVIDGVLGLAFPSISGCKPKSEPCVPFFDRISPSLPTPLFTATLRHQQPGMYDFGFIDANEYSCSLTYTNVDSSHGKWLITIDAIQVYYTKVAISLPAIVDTGATRFMTTTTVANAYWYSQTVPGSQYYVDSNPENSGWVFPCSSYPSAFSIYIGSQRIIMPGIHILGGPAPESAGSNMCYGLIQNTTSASEKYSVIGDALLKSQFVVFDRREPPQVGFAPQPKVSNLLINNPDFETGAATPWGVSYIAAGGQGTWSVVAAGYKSKYSFSVVVPASPLAPQEYNSTQVYQLIYPFNMDQAMCSFSLDYRSAKAGKYKLDVSLGGPSVLSVSNFKAGSWLHHTGTVTTSPTYFTVTLTNLDKVSHTFYLDNLYLYDMECCPTCYGASGAS